MSDRILSLQAIELFFKDLPESELAYVDFHKYRYRYLIELIDTYLQDHSDLAPTILDIGPAYQTKLVRSFFPSAIVHSLGFTHPANVLRSNERHINFDLNDAADRWPEEMPKCEMILFCEVIEHVYTKPELILRHLRDMLTPGGWLIIQTPNAVAIHKRMAMLIGRNPFQLLHENKMGHFREYTLAELQTMLAKSNFDTVIGTRQNYFNPSAKISHQLFRRFGNLMPASWRDGITIVSSPT